MEIEFSKDLSRNVDLASRELGITKKEVIARAVFLYLRNVKEFEALNKEIQEWEEAGVEDAIDWEEENLKDE